MPGSILGAGDSAVNLRQRISQLTNTSVSRKMKQDESVGRTAVLGWWVPYYIVRWSGKTSVMCRLSCEQDLDVWEERVLVGGNSQWS